MAGGSTLVASLHALDESACKRLPLTSNELHATAYMPPHILRLTQAAHSSIHTQVVIDDLRAELPGNDPASTAARAAELRVTQAACAANATKALLAAASAAVPEHVRSRAASRAASRAPSRAGGSAPPSALGAGRKKGAAAKGEADKKSVAGTPAPAAAVAAAASGAGIAQAALAPAIPEAGEDVQPTVAARGPGPVAEGGDGQRQSAALPPEALEAELRRRKEEERAFQGGAMS